MGMDNKCVMLKEDINLKAKKHLKTLDLPKCHTISMYIHYIEKHVIYMH